jgi:hypothetical protein
MSIWGEADANEFPDDPFRIEPNWYPAVSVECYEKEVDPSQGVSQLIVKWKIRKPGSEFDGLPVTDRKTYYKLPNDQLDGEQRRANGFLKMMLRQAFDLAPDEINNFDPKMGLNREAVVEVTNNPDKTNPDIVYNNIRTVLSKRLHMEKHGGVNNDSGGYDASSLLNM